MSIHFRSNIFNNIPEAVLQKHNLTTVDASEIRLTSWYGKYIPLLTRFYTSNRWWALGFLNLQPYHSIDVKKFESHLDVDTLSWSNAWRNADLEQIIASVSWWMDCRHRVGNPWKIGPNSKKGLKKEIISSPPKKMFLFLRGYRVFV